MFQIIDSSEHDSHREVINSFMEYLRSHNLSLFKPFRQMDKATLILAKENPNPIKGGAILLKKKYSILHPIIQEQLKDTIAPHQKVWTGTLYLHFPKELQCHIFESLCKVFYKSLYTSIIAFGAKEKTDFLCLTLDPCEHLSTDLLGPRLYKIGARYRESLDGLFHRVLVLTGAQNKFKDLAA